MDVRCICRVCGYIHDTPIRDESGNLLIHELCICCGVQWGGQDTTLQDIREYRERWLEGGAVWRWPIMEPDDWEVEKQLVNIPPQFR